MNKHFQELVLSKVVHCPSGCWLWAGANNAEKDPVRLYGRITLNKTIYPAHRFSYLAFWGDIPKSFHVCHKCDVPMCVNPSHLFLGTHKDNMKDMSTKGRGSKQKVTHCPRNHPYDEENTIKNKYGRRLCKTCEKARIAAYDARNREKRMLAARSYRARKKSLSLNESGKENSL